MLPDCASVSRTIMLYRREPSGMSCTWSESTLVWKLALPLPHAETNKAVAARVDMSRVMVVLLSSRPQRRAVRRCHSDSLIEAAPPGDHLSRVGRRSHPIRVRAMVHGVVEHHE